MAKGNSRNKRTKSKDSGRRTKKKISPLNSDSITYVDYKDVDLLRRFISYRAKIRSRRVTGNDAQQQREVARAIKNAREMGLLAYTSRVTTQRRGGRRDDRDGGGRRDDRDGGGRRDDRDGGGRSRPGPDAMGNRESAEVARPPEGAEPIEAESAETAAVAPAEETVEA